MNAVARKKIEAQVVDRLGHVFERHEKQSREVLNSGIGEIDRVLGGFPRGSITEVHGTTSSGRTSLMLATLAAATLNEEACALIDCSDTFDLRSAAQARVSFDRLLWVRCRNNFERAFKATDLLLHGGGFGLVVLNLTDIASSTLRRIISTWWFRFRRAIENTPTVLLVLTPAACARSCAAMALELKYEAAVWAGTGSFVTRPQNPAPHLADGSSKRLSLVEPATVSNTCGSGWLLRPVVTSEFADQPLAAAGTDFITGERSRAPHMYLPNHAHFLSAATVHVNRERPVAFSNHTIRFSAIAKS